MLTKIFAQFGMINWRTTMTGISGAMVSLGVIANAYRTKDFATIFSQAQTLVPIIIGAVVFLQGIFAKDSTVTGVGSQAAVLTDNNKLITVQGDTVKNPPAGV